MGHITLNYTCPSLYTDGENFIIRISIEVLMLSLFTIVRWCLLLIGISSHTSFADEFLYPVAVSYEHEKPYIYVVYQKSLEHLELWLWDPESKEVSKALLSAFTPAGLRLLPQGQGFSFIDNGRIKIKQFNKRSPKTIELNEPLYDVTQVEWLNPTSFFLSAKERERFNIYQVDIQGNTEHIVSCEQADCLYPQKIGSDLFYIERSRALAGGCRHPHGFNDYHEHVLVTVPYPSVALKKEPSFNDQEQLEEKMALLLNDYRVVKKPLTDDTKKMPLYNFGTMSVAFLHMESARQGFVVEYPRDVEKHDATLPLTYHQIFLTENGWQSKALFDFEIPLHLLWPSSQSRLYESMLPLLPRHIEDKIYFVDCAKSTKKQRLDIFCYTVADGTIKQQTSSRGFDELFMGIVSYNKMLFYGGGVDTLVPFEDDPLDLDCGESLQAARSGKIPYCWYSEDGSLFLHLPALMA
jgi:hypothetical protein